MKIPVGIDKETGDIVLIDMLSDDKRGLRCNCICPECKSDLSAKMGEQKVHHFAHHKGNETQTCQETALHLYGKYVLSKLQDIAICSYELESSKHHDILGREYFSENISLFGEQKVLINSSELEKTVGKIRSDVFSETLYEDKNLNINFEIKVWHEVDEIKYEKIKALNLTTVEIDLSDLLHEKNVDFELIKQEIYNPNNQRIIFIENNLINKYIEEAEFKLKSEIDTINAKISQWLLVVEQKLVREGILLPEFKYNLLNVPFKTMDRKVLPKKPNISKLLSVKNFCHLKNNEFEMLCHLGGRDKMLPVFINLNRSYEVAIANADENSYLIFDEAYLEKTSDELHFEWGVNKIAEQYQDQYNLAINREIDKKEVKDLAVVFKNINIVNELADKKQVQQAYNYQAIRETANGYYKELVGKGLDPNLIERSIIEEIDSHHIYGCETKYWQLIALRDLCWVNNANINVPFLSKRLKSYGIDLVGPYKELLFKKGLIEKNGIEIPFITSYKMLYEFLNHLVSIKILSRNYGGYFSKNLIFGDDYKNKTKFEKG